MPHCRFGAPAFRFIYNHIELMGGCFLLSGGTLIASGLYPGWHPAIAWVGRVIFVAALGVYWWHVAVLGGGPTGTMVYPLMALGVLIEGRRRRPTQLFPAFIASVGLCFGALMLVYGLFTMVEAVRQIMGIAGERQQKKADVVIAQGNGCELSHEAMLILGSAATV